MKQIQKASIFIFLILFIVGCNTPNPNTPGTDEPVTTNNDDTGTDTSIVNVEGNNPTPGNEVEPEPVNKKPNIIIFYADDLGYQPQCYGGKVAETPNINKLAKDGILFKDGYVSGCVCSPSRVALLTGRYQQRTGHDGNTTAPGKQLNTNEITIAQRLKNLGYVTGMFGKWHIGHYGKKQLPTARGFDVFVGSAGNLSNKGDSYYEGTEKIEKIKGHPRTTRRWTNEALDFIDENKEKPFFVYLPFHAVHTPRLSHKSNFVKYGHYEVMEKQRFASVLDELDECIGDVMEKLRKESLEENTLVFFISDNGVGKMKKADIKNGGLKGNKWELWEGGIRVPFIMQWKGKLPANTVSETPVIQIDVLPTVIAAANGKVEESWNLDGENLLPLFAKGNKEELKRNALYWRFGTQYAIRKDNWKLVKVYSDQKNPVLINLEKDKGEEKDLYNEHPEKAKELQVAWDKWNATMKPPRWEDERWNIESPK